MLAYKLFLYIFEIPDLDTVYVFLHKQFKSNMKDCHGWTQISICVIISKVYLSDHPCTDLQTFQQFISMN